MKRDVGPVDDALTGPRPVAEEPALASLLLSDNVPCEGDGVVVVGVDVGDLLGEAFVVVCVAEVLGVAWVEAAAEPVVGLELEGHDVEEASRCVVAGALLPDVERGGSVLGALLLGSALSLVLTPVLGLEVSLPVDGLLGLTSGLGDALGKLEEADGLGFTEGDADELVLAAAAVDEADPAGLAGGHDDATPAGAVVNPPPPDVLPFNVPPPPADWPPGCELVGGVGEFEARPDTVAIPRYSGGMAARSTPTANTAMPTARAGRSIASRQSLGRCGARWECLGSAPEAAGEVCPPGTARPRPTRPARNPAMASRKAAHRGNLAVAWAGRDWIFSRIRSRPSRLGSI